MTNKQQKMKFTTLENVSQSVLTACFNAGFADYAIKFNASDAYLANRWASGGVDFSLSGGAWSEGQLIGMVIIMYDEPDGVKTAFNGATCVVPEARGQKITQRIFAFLAAKFQARGIKKLQLEVLTENERAIRVYEKIGFRKARKLLCFKPAKTLTATSEAENFTIRECTSPLPLPAEYLTNLPAWEQKNASLYRLPEQYRWFHISDDKKEQIWIALNPNAKLIAQIYKTPGCDFERCGKVLFSYLQKHQLPLRFINVDENAEELIQFLQSLGMENYINQYEMELMTEV